MKYYLLAVLLMPCFCSGQALEPDAEGCKDSKVISRMRACRISECGVTEFGEAEIPMGMKGGETAAKTLEGAIETLAFECASGITALQVVRNVEGALRQAGFNIVFAGRNEHEQQVVTAQKGPQWVTAFSYFNGSAAEYRVTTLKVAAMAQEMTANAESMAAEINKSGRVAVYGINFVTAKATVKSESEPVLAEIAKLMQNNPEWKFRLEGHTDNVGAKASNLALSRQRAAAVAAWLAGQGVDKSRLSAEGFGDSKPVSDNTTDEGRAKNRRVELVKM